MTTQMKASQPINAPSMMAPLILLTLLSSSLSVFGQALPPAPDGKVFVLTPTPGPFTEPAIAIDPNNPKEVLAVFQDNVHASYSQDAGETWTAAEGVAPPDFKVSGDVSTTYDNQGHAFICYIAFDKLGTVNYWGHGATRNGVFVRRSLDGGRTWEKDHSPVAEQLTQPGIPFEDKPYIVADTSHSRYAGNLYVGWTRWTLTNSLMLISRSTDDGKTWSAPVEIDRQPGLPRDDNGGVEGFDGVVGPDGRLYAVWSQGDDIYLTMSKDGGKKFSRAHSILHTAPIMFTIDAVERANGFPQIAIDPRSGRLYVTWSDYRNGDLDVFSSTSSDGGKKWSAPVRVNNDSIHDGADQFFQWLAVDPVDGSANVLFYDRRTDPQNRKQAVTLARSTNGGESFSNYAWPTNLFDATEVFFGDYTGIAASGGRVYGIWTEKDMTSGTVADLSKQKNDNTETDENERAEKMKSVENKAGGEKKDQEEAVKKPGATKPKRKGTVVKVGIADFH